MKNGTAKKPNLFVRLLALLVSCALVLGALTLVVYRDKLNADALRRWLTYRNLETNQLGQSEPFTHVGGERLQISCLDRSAIIASQAGVSLYSTSGQPLVVEVATMDHPVLSSNGSTAVVYDAGGQSLYVFQKLEEMFALPADSASQILSAQVNENGWLVVTAQQSGYKGSITVYNGSYEKVIQINLSSTFVVDAALSPDNKTVAVVTMGQENGVFQSRLLFYPIDSTQPSDEVALGNLTVLNMKYEDNQIWILGEKQMLLVSPRTHETQQWSFGQYYLKSCTLGGDGYAVLLLSRYRAASAELAVVLGPEGTPLSEKPLQGQTISACARGRYLALLGSNGLEIYLAQDLSPYATLTDTQGARLVSLFSDGSALLADSQEAWLYLPD